MDINKIDYIPMLLDVNALPSLELYIKLSYADKRHNKVVKVERDKKYRIVYHKNHHLHRIVGRIVDITRVFNEDINYDGTKKKPDYIITVDASTEYGSNVKKLYVYQIRAIKEYVEHMDEDNTILDATTIGGTTSSSIIKNATVEIEIPKDIIADNPDGTEITIPELEVAEGIITDGEVPDTGTTTGGLSTGVNPNGNKILVNKGTTHGGTIIHGTIIKGKMYNVTIIINRSTATYIINGDINNTIINGTTINGGTSIGGEVSIVNKENTIVFGGVVYGDTMVTIGGTTTISKDPDTGEYYTEIQKYAKDNNAEFWKNLGVLFAVTDGFKNIDKVVKTNVKKEVKKSMRNLEHLLNGSNLQSDGSLNYISGVSSDNNSYIGKGIMLDV